MQCSAINHLLIKVVRYTRSSGPLKLAPQSQSPLGEASPSSSFSSPLFSSLSLSLSKRLTVRQVGNKSETVFRKNCKEVSAHEIGCSTVSPPSSPLLPRALATSTRALLPSNSRSSSDFERGLCGTGGDGGGGHSAVGFGNWERASAGGEMEGEGGREGEEKVSAW